MYFSSFFRCKTWSWTAITNLGIEKSSRKGGITFDGVILEPEVGKVLVLLVHVSRASVPLKNPGYNMAAPLFDLPPRRLRPIGLVVFINKRWHFDLNEVSFLRHKEDATYCNNSNDDFHPSGEVFRVDERQGHRVLCQSEEDFENLFLQENGGFVVVPRRELVDHLLNQGQEYFHAHDERLALF